jgi:hypothetical protein
MLCMCVYTYSRFVENHPIRILEDGPSFLRWFCHIDYHICRNIFDMIDIMYYRLPFISRCVLPLNTLVL